ncbi:hypothetical protein D9M68_123200 [compost metagenome]
MPAEDKFKFHQQQLSSPSRDFVAATKDDNADLPQVSRAIYVGTGGDVNAVREDGTVVLFKNVGSGTILPIRCYRIKAAGTTASDFVVL